MAMLSGMPVPLSILDLVPLADGATSALAFEQALSLARLAERLGYERLWYAEHHNMPSIASTSPALMIARSAMVTSRLRLGAGGVMLPNHAPLAVAEAYRMLEAMAPGRVDLGIGRAPGTDPTTAAALRGSREAVYTDEFPAKLAELMAFASDGFPTGHPFRAVTAQPADVPLPPLWLLGSSDYSAHLAARLGLGYAFAAHFSPEAPEGPMLAYRDEFRPGPLARPHAILAVSVFCAETTAAAERMALPTLVAFARLRTGKPARLLGDEAAAAYVFTPAEEAAARAVRASQIVGPPYAVRAQIDDLARRTQADEVMVTTFAADHAERMRSFERVAAAFEMTPRA